MALYHNVIFAKDFNVFEEVVVGFLNLMIHILLKELNKLQRIPDNPEPGLAGSGLGCAVGILSLQILVFQLNVEPRIQGVRQHESL